VILAQLASGFHVAVLFASLMQLDKLANPKPSLDFAESLVVSKLNPQFNSLVSCPTRETAFVVAPSRPKFAKMENVFKSFG